MDIIHCIEIVFPLTSAKPKKNIHNPSTLVNFSSSLQLPTIHKRTSSKLLIPQLTKPVLPEDILKSCKTTISHIEEKFSPIHSQNSSISKHQFIKNKNGGKYYLKFYNKIENDRKKRLQNTKNPRAISRDNPWRYNVVSPNSVFDANLVAAKTFKSNSIKKSPRISR